MIEELLAQMIEEQSILSADRRRKKPREVPRPGSLQTTTTAPDRPRDARYDSGAVSTSTHGGLLAAALGAGMVMSSNG